MQIVQTQFIGCAVVLWLGGCVAAADGEDALEEPVAGIEQAIGEASCPDDNTARLNVSDQPNAIAVITSPDAAYGDPRCMNAFTTLVRFQKSKRIPWLQVGYAGPALRKDSPYPCDAGWVRGVIWHWEGSWVKVADKTESGANGALSGTCNPAGFNWTFGARTNPNDDWYAVSAQAGVIFSYMPVKVMATNLD